MVAFSVRFFIIVMAYDGVSVCKDSLDAIFKLSICYDKMVDKNMSD